LDELFDVDRTFIVKHIRNIYKAGELHEDSTSAIFTQDVKGIKFEL